MSLIIKKNDVSIAEEIYSYFSEEIVNVKVTVNKESTDIHFHLKYDSLENKIVGDAEMKKHMLKIIKKYSNISSAVSYSTYIESDFSSHIKFTPLISYSTVEIFSHKYLIQLCCKQIDEEGQGYLADLKSQWIKQNLTQNQIEKKELLFIVEHYWGRFVSWLRLPRIISLTITK